MMTTLLAVALTAMAIANGSADLPGRPCGPAADPAVASVPGTMEAGGIRWLRQESRARGATPRLARLGASLGASLAWELADLPRHDVRLPEPIGAFVPGAAFGALRMDDAIRPGGAIAARIDRWNALYPPYALETAGGR